MVEHRITTYHCKSCSKFLFEHNSDIAIDNERRMITLKKRNQNIYNPDNAGKRFYCKYCNAFLGISKQFSRICVQIRTRRIDKITTILHEDF